MDSDTDDDVNLNDTEDDSSDYSFKSCTENEEEDVSTTLGVRETTVTLGDTSAIPSMKETSSCEDPSTTDEEAGGVGEGSAANYGETSFGIEESVRGAEGTSSTTSVGQLCIPGLETTTGAETVVYTRGAEPTRSSLVPSCSGSTPVHQVGGSVATNMAQTNWKASGEQILEVAGALFKKAKDSDYTLSMETVKQELSGAKEVHFNMTKTDIYEPTAVAIGGDVRVGPETQAPPTALQQLKSKTERTYKDWTEGMVETKATKTILNKIAAGRTWVTVTGCPGEGKTTAGYFVLKHLHDRGREVFDVKTPKDFLKVKESKQSVIMLNDIFGALSYDPDSLKKWQNVLSDVLALSEHKEDAKDESHKAKKKRIPELTVILISRLSVLKEAGEDLGKYKHLVLSEDNVVNLTKAESETSERMKIWMCYAERYDITIDSRLVREICNLKLSHGFPHCCKLFAAMYSENNQLKMRDFFLKPLEFLNQSMESLLKDPLTGPLLREMLKNDGSLCLESVDDFERRYQYSSVAESLRDTYLFLNGLNIEFCHPSIYDSAAFVVCQKDPSFVISHCSLSFLNERVRLKGLTQNSNSHYSLMVDSAFDKLLIKRFRNEFDDRNILGVLSHTSFLDEGFVSRFMHNLLPINNTMPMSKQVKELLSVCDKHSKKSFLFLMTKSGSV